MREYIYLPATEIVPTFRARAQVDRPLAVVNAVNTASPLTWYVHVDHLARPIKMTDGAKVSVWDACAGHHGGPGSDPARTGCGRLTSSSVPWCFECSVGLSGYQ